VFGNGVSILKIYKCLFSEESGKKFIISGQLKKTGNVAINFAGSSLASITIGLKEKNKIKS